MLDPKKKMRLIEAYKTHKGDTGSPEVQIAILTEEIRELTKHLKEHRHDFSSRRGLFRKVGQRRRLLRYLERENPKSFEKLVVALKIKIGRRTEQLAVLEELIKTRDEEHAAAEEEMEDDEAEEAKEDKKAKK
jgi:small subunit ribosomal protein S15